MTIEVTDANLEGVLKGNEITMIDFWAPWCNPCKMLGPVIDELSGENKEKLNLAIGKVNVDNNIESAKRYGIRNIPTILFFKNGIVVDKITGFKTKPELQAKIDALLS